MLVLMHTNGVMYLAHWCVPAWLNLTQNSKMTLTVSPRFCHLYCCCNWGKNTLLRRILHSMWASRLDFRPQTISQVEQAFFKQCRALIFLSLSRSLAYKGNSFVHISLLFDAFYCGLRRPMRSLLWDIFLAFSFCSCRSKKSTMLQCSPSACGFTPSFLCSAPSLRSALREVLLILHP